MIAMKPHGLIYSAPLKGRWRLTVVQGAAAGTAPAMKRTPAKFGTRMDEKNAVRSASVLRSILKTIHRYERRSICNRYAVLSILDPEMSKPANALYQRGYARFSVLEIVNNAPLGSVTEPSIV